MNKLHVLSLVLATAAALPLAAHAASDHGAVRAPGVVVAQAAGAAADMADGEVRKIDKENQKITLKHGEIKSLDMPGMTMVFQVRDPALLDQVKPGDKVKFSAEKTGSAFVVTTIEVAR